MLEPSDIMRIRQLPLLRTCAVDTFTRLMGKADLQRFARGVELTTEGEPSDVLYVLLEGAVELEGAWNARDTTLALLRPLSTFVLASVVLDVPALTTARTAMRSQVLMIPGAALRQAARDDAAFSYAIAEELSGCYSGVVRTLKNYKLRGALERVANYLLSQQQHQGGASIFRLPCQKRVVASLLGMTPENLSRAFAALAAHGVKIDGPLVTVTQPRVLLRLAKPDALIDDHVTRTDDGLGQAGRGAEA